MITTAEFNNWLLLDSSVRVILMEVWYKDGAGNSRTAYFSNYPYVSEPTDTPANTPYDDIISGVPQIKTQLVGSSNLGTVEILNVDGEYDDYLHYAFEGHELKIYIGDPSWSRNDFRLILSGIVESIEASGVNAIKFTVRDKKKLLDIPLQRNRTSTPLYPETDNKLIPIAIGTCFNVEPVLINHQNLTYAVHESSCQVTAVRDKGVPLTRITSGNPTAGQYLDSLDGTFRLGGSPAGQITCDVNATVQSGGVPTSSASEIVKWLALRGGITQVGIDQTNFSAFPNTAPLGYYITDDIEVSSVIDNVLKSVGGYWRFNRLGVLQIFRLDLPDSAYSITLVPDDIQARGLSVGSVDQPRYEGSIGYKRNWKIQSKDSLAGSVSDQDKEIYSTKHLILSQSDLSILDMYPLAEADEIIESLFYNMADAEAELNRRMSITSSKRFTYKIRAYSAPLSISVGDTINLIHPRFGFDNGATVRVLSISEKPNDDRVDLEVWK